MLLLREIHRNEPRVRAWRSLKDARHVRTNNAPKIHTQNKPTRKTHSQAKHPHTFGVDNGTGSDGNNGETKILDALHQSVSGAKLVVGDYDAHQGPQRGCQNGIRHAKYRHGNVWVDEARK